MLPCFLPPLHLLVTLHTLAVTNDGLGKGILIMTYFIVYFGSAESVTANGNIVCGHQNFAVTAVWSVWWGSIKPSFFVPCLNCEKHQALTHCVLVSRIFLLLSFCL